MNVWRQPEDGADRGRNLPILLLYYGVLVNINRTEYRLSRTPLEIAKVVLRIKTIRDTFKLRPDMA